MDRGAWQVAAHGVAKNQMQLSDYTQHSTEFQVLVYCEHPKEQNDKSQEID